MSAPITPLPLALVICDGFWRDPYTNKLTLIGTFSAIGGGRYPLTHPILTVYACLTGGRGRIPIRIELVDVDEQRDPVLVQEGEVEFTDPRQVVELTFEAAGLKFPEPGEYRLKLLANREFLMERRIYATIPQPPA